MKHILSGLQTHVSIKAEVSSTREYDAENIKLGFF